jgi:pre-mRNA cleavage complex 2 protein Pcf11
LFPTFLGKLYLKTYREVDGVTKSKMEEMLKLWRTGGPYGAELYPATMREEVERQIIGTSAVLTQPQVQANLRQFLKEKEAEMANEFSTSRAKTVNVLVQIDQLLSSSQVSPKELADISEKVRAMKAGLEPKSSQLTRLQTAAGGAGATGGASPQPGSAQPRSGFPNQPPTAFAQQQQPPPPQPQPQQQLPFRNPGGQSPFPPFPAHGNQQPAPVAAPAAIPAIPALSAVSAIPMNVADILRNLNNSGVLSAPRTPEPTKPKSGLDNYEEMILALDIRVDFLDPNR